jgi:hypothetical protein
MKARENCCLPFKNLELLVTNLPRAGTVGILGLCVRSRAKVSLHQKKVKVS